MLKELKAVLKDTIWQDIIRPQIRVFITGTPAMVPQNLGTPPAYVPQLQHEGSVYG